MTMPISRCCWSMENYFSQELSTHRWIATTHVIVQLSTNLPAVLLQYWLILMKLSNEHTVPKWKRYENRRHNWWRAFNLNRNQLKISSVKCMAREIDLLLVREFVMLKSLKWLIACDRVQKVFIACFLINHTSLPTDVSEIIDILFVLCLALFHALDSDICLWHLCSAYSLHSYHARWSFSNAHTHTLRCQ